MAAYPRPSSTGMTPDSGRTRPVPPRRTRRGDHLPDQQQEPDVPDQHPLHLRNQLVAGLSGRPDVEAAAVDGVAARQVDPDRDHEDDEEKAGQDRRLALPDPED